MAWISWLEQSSHPSSRLAKHVRCARDDKVFGSNGNLLCKDKLTWRSVIAMQFDLSCAVERMSFIANVKLTSPHPESERIQNSRLAKLKRKLAIDFDTSEDW
jgi:hypothetical protein